MDIHITAPLLTKSGYGVHSRQIFQWALEFCQTHKIGLTVNPTNWGATGWYVHKDSNEGLTGEILKRMSRPQTKVDLHIFVGLPNEFLNDWGIKARKTVAITAGVESTKCNSNWKAFVNNPNIDRVIAPSQFTKDGLVAGGCSSSKIQVIPEAYIQECETDHPALDIGDVPDKNVLVISSVMLDSVKDRKNFFNTMLCLKKSLNGQTEVGAVLKVNAAGRGSVDRYLTIRGLEEIKKALGLDFPITLVHGELSDSQLVGLYKHPKINCLLTLTRGEGFGLPILEAAACGLPIIASDWSAHTEFLDHKFMKVKGREVPIPEERKDPQIWVDGKWFEPDINKASSVINRFFNDSKFRSTTMDNAKALQKFVNLRYSLSCICKKYDEFFGGLLKL